MFDHDYSIDLEACEQFLVADPGSTRKIKRGTEAMDRTRFSTKTTRFADWKNFQTKDESGNRFDLKNFGWLARRWTEENGRRIPTKYEVINGICREQENIDETSFDDDPFNLKRQTH